MKLYFAPLEGITGHLYRGIHKKHFSGIDQYYAPFVVTREGGIMKNKELRDILPENNQGVHLVPQILTNEAKNFLHASGQMFEIGYEQVNLNLGCPSGTVTGKGRGAGFLKWENRQKLESFLDEIFDKAQGPVSIKTRIGFEEPEEFDEILKLYQKYPISELIIHPRTRKEMYGGQVHKEIFDVAYEKYQRELCYNGDVTTVGDYKEIINRYPDISGVMIGRGLIANPGLCDRIMGQIVTKEQIYSFYEDIFLAYKEELSGDVHLLHKMKEMWIFMAPNFTNYERYLKKIKKAKKLKDYQETIDLLFSEEEWTG